MKKRLGFILLVLIIHLISSAQRSSIIVLGDIHIDRMEHHDLEYLHNKPDDLRQVKEYSAITEANWSDFMQVIREKATFTAPSVKAVVQLGDLSEGLAGTEKKARQMASYTMKAVEETRMPAPWILVKGNHDVTGPGAAGAFEEFYIPEIQKQTKNPAIKNASYSWRLNEVQITCIDPWDNEMNMISFLENELSGSDARFKFVAIHEPVIPVTERCWHVYRNNAKKREKLLEVIARNKAIVLCGHLHRYSVVSRTTPYGPVIQVMVLSVVRDISYTVPDRVITTYGPSLAQNVPEWQPATLQSRKEILSNEAKFVTYYKQTDLPGYAIIKTDSKKGDIQLEYYAAFGEHPYDKINLTNLLEKQ